MYDNVSENGREIFIFGSINQQMSHDVISKLLILNSDDKKGEITIYINSNGGSAVDGLAICDAMHLVKYDVKTVCIGVASSIAAVILLSGTNGKRYITKNSCVMMHEVSADSSGKISDITTELDHIKNINQQMKKEILQYTNIDNSEIDNLLLKNKWYNAEEAIKMGIVDNII